MLSDAVLRRLGELNREPLPSIESAVGAVRSNGDADEVVVPVALGGSAFAPSTFHSTSAAEVVFPPLEPRRPTFAPVVGQAFCDPADLPAIEPLEIENASGAHAVLRRPVTDYWPHCPFRQSLPETVEGGPDLNPTGRRQSRADAELNRVRRVFPGSVLFLDLETCGLGSSMIFLVGLVRASDDCLVVEQLLARNYQEERSILEALWQLVPAADALVTFNGKSFDWPLIEDRSMYHRMEIHPPAEPGAKGGENGAIAGQSPSFVHPNHRRVRLFHCDLLHHARRKWRHVLPNCKLQTLERMLCGRGRNDDIPGHLIPQAYHNYVRNGRTDELDRILHHNALDLVTLVELTVRMIEESTKY